MSIGESIGYMRQSWQEAEIVMMMEAARRLLTILFSCLVVGSTLFGTWAPPRRIAFLLWYCDFRTRQAVDSWCYSMMVQQSREPARESISPHSHRTARTLLWKYEEHSSFGYYGCSYCCDGRCCSCCCRPWCCCCCRCWEVGRQAAEYRYELLLLEQVRNTENGPWMLIKRRKRVLQWIWQWLLFLPSSLES